VPAVRDYIVAQPDHHRKRSFQEGYLELLKQHEIDIDERFMW